MFIYVFIYVSKEHGGVLLKVKRLSEYYVWYCKDNYPLMNCFLCNIILKLSFEKQKIMMIGLMYDGVCIIKDKCLNIESEFLLI